MLKRCFFIGLMVFILVGISFWSFKIWKTNSDGKTGSWIEYGMNEKIDLSHELSVVAVRASYLSSSHFLREFHGNRKDLENWGIVDSHIICCCFMITNQSNRDITWDEISEQLLEYGFETRTWGSASMPILGANMNCYASDVLSCGKSDYFWCATGVAPVCFREKNYERLKVSDFYYDVALYPKRIRVRLG